MPIQRWLLKTEPSVYSFEDLARDGRTVWDGITNALALQNLRKACGGDLALIYHTGAVRSAVGIARILGAPYPDPKRGNPSLVVVDLEAVRPLEAPVALDAMKASPKLRGFDLLRLPRLTVVPVSPEHWSVILKISGTRV
jgi:predicted RNA-binding protein with PUA-like domain